MFSGYLPNWFICIRCDINLSLVCKVHGEIPMRILGNSVTQRGYRFCWHPGVRYLGLDSDERVLRR